MSARRNSSLVFLSAILAISMCFIACSTVRLGQHPYSSKVTVGTQSVEVRYLLYLPDTYGEDRRFKWPLIMFLHGYGERGNNLELLKNHPLPQTLELQTDFPFIVVSPQLPGNISPWDSQIETLSALLERIESSYSVDRKRLYLTGLSMGGAGTWEFALRYPNRFAAIVPVAGFYKYQSRELPRNMCDLRNLPIWVFHGAMDTSVPLYQAEILVEALKACGSGVRFTVYEDADHEVTWRRAYADPALIEWLAAQTLE
jgi:predicted peptidase